MTPPPAYAGFGYSGFFDVNTTPQTACTSARQVQSAPSTETDMTTENTTLQHLATRAHQNARQKGFHEDRLNDSQFMERHCGLLHAEVSELFEAVRAGRLFSPCDKDEKMEAMGLPVLNCAEEELADIIIRSLDISQRLRLDIERAVLAKMAYNATRPHKHGKEF